MTPVKERKRCEEAIILDCISDGVVTIGLDLRIRFINKAMREMLGYAKEELLGSPMSCNLIVQSNICSTHECVIERALRNREKVSNFETVIQNRDGRRIPVKLNTDLLWSEDGKLIGVVETFRDLSQVHELKEKLERQSKAREAEPIIAKSKALTEILDLLPQVANSKATVLIEGESGTGKELIAKEIHRLSPRQGRPFIPVNCGALAEGVLESELFGHVKGAFTGAITDRPGRFEAADQGTILLDEIAEINLATQVKLLRVLQAEEFERVGSSTTRRIDVRVIAATNKDLSRLVQEGKFREALYYRLRVFPVKIPPLRERREDIFPLIEHCMQSLNAKMDKYVRDIDDRALEFFKQYDYPGNVRELENLLEHCFIRCPDHTLRAEHLPQDLFKQEWEKRHVGPVDGGRLERNKPLAAIEREMIETALGEGNWSYKKACQVLGISRSTLSRRIKQYGLKRK